MRRLFPFAAGFVVNLATACGSASGGVVSAEPDGAALGMDVPDGSVPDGKASLLDAAAPDGATSGAWDGSFSGPLACSGGGAFTANYTGSCGIERWAIKTGADAVAPTISLLPQLTTIATLGAIPAPTSLPSSTRVKPTESTVFAVKDVKLTFARLEDDGDYHLVLTDGTNAMIAEVPYPGGTCTKGSAWQCLLSKARATVDAQLTLQLLKGKVENFVVSVAGVGFFDTEHSQFGAAPNAIEMHPVLEICFGVGCSLSK